MSWMPVSSKFPSFSNWADLSWSNYFFGTWKLNWDNLVTLYKCVLDPRLLLPSTRHHLLCCPCMKENQIADPKKLDSHSYVLSEYLKCPLYQS